MSFNSSPGTIAARAMPCSMDDVFEMARARLEARGEKMEPSTDDRIRVRVARNLAHFPIDLLNEACDQAVVSFAGGATMDNAIAFACGVARKKSMQLPDGSIVRIRR